MKRRTLLASVASAMTLPIAGHTQSGKVFRVGVLTGGSASPSGRSSATR